MKSVLHTPGLALAAILLLLSACRQLVWEQRDRCPVHLGFEIANADAFSPEERLHITVFGPSGTEPAAADSTLLREVQEGSFGFWMPVADEWSGYGLVGFENSRLEAPARWMIEEGRDADPLFRFDFHMERFEGSSVAQVELVKDHAKVHLQFLHYERFGAPDGTFPFEIVLVGNSCGVDGRTGVPLEGVFRHRPAEESAGSFRFILPRQGDNSLVMELWAKPGLSEREGLVDRLNLGSLLHQLGRVNWEAKNLPDLDLTLDYGEARLDIEVVEWELAEALSFDI